MNFTANYQVTSTLQDESIRFYYFRVMFRPRLSRLLIVAALLVVIVLLVPQYLLWSSAFAAAVVILLTATWTRAYFFMRKQARQGLELMEHPNVEIALDEEGILYSSSTGTRRHLWDKVRRIVESRDFIVLMNGDIPLLNLPKAPFSEEALEFIRRKSWVERKE